MMRIRLVLLTVIAMASQSSPVMEKKNLGAPRTLSPIRAGNIVTRSRGHCNGKLSSCSDCTNVLYCFKLGSLFRPLYTKLCPASAPYCVEGQCTTSLVDEDECNSAGGVVTELECTGNGYFPAPSDCKKYFLCVDGNAYEYDCLDYKNTVYSHSKAMCVPSTEVKCSTANCSAGNVGSYQMWGQDKSVYFVCIDTRPANAHVADCGEDMQVDPASGNCVRACHRVGRLSDQTHPSKYFECVRTGTTYSVPIPRTCPGTATFSVEQERCVYPGSSDEDSKTTEFLELFYEPRSDISEDVYKVPDSLLIGAATSAYQVEGAWNSSLKSPSIIDVFYHSRPSQINGDVACRSYEKYKEDIQALKDLGMKSYRFSIAWTRVLPSGDQSGGADAVGVAYYDSIIDELKAHNIEPIVTMHHWDIPQSLQNDGGWLNPNTQEHFLSYADFLFKTFGDRVKIWVLMNEPCTICTLGYEVGTAAPGVSEPGTGAYRCAHNMILAHAKAYRLYEAEYKQNQKGMLGSSLDITYYQPLTTRAADVAAADRMTQFQLDWILHPLVSGDYPKAMRDMVDANSKGEGLEKSRLPEFTEEERKLVRGTLDFVGINHFTTLLVTPGAVETTASYNNDTFASTTTRPEWSHSARYNNAMCPWGIRAVLNYIKVKYNNIAVLITESGWSGPTEEPLRDKDRVKYYSTYMRALLRAINEDHCNVIGYIAWSLVDNLEWGHGYSARFGLVHVDFNDPERKRTLKTGSAEFFKSVFQNKQVPYVN